MIIVECLLKTPSLRAFDNFRNHKVVDLEATPLQDDQTLTPTKRSSNQHKNFHCSTNFKAFCHRFKDYNLFSYHSFSDHSYYTT